MDSFKVARIWGIDVRVHYSFVLFLGLSVLLDVFTRGLASALISTLCIASFFGCVVLHEMGHCAAAKYRGVAVRDITLWPLGGFATMDLSPSLHRIEWQIALAGPLANLLLAFVLTPIALVASHFANSEFLTWLVLANVFLFLLNLLPAFPLDGGRAYRSWRARRVGFREATREVARMSVTVSIALFVLGIFNFWFFFLAIFVYLASQQESMMAEYGQSPSPRLHAHQQGAFELPPKAKLLWKKSKAIYHRCLVRIRDLWNSRKLNDRR